MRLPASRTGRWLAGTLAALFLFRLWFAAALPLTGDEAYFVAWGGRPAGGYYDHPPMIGWWLAGLLPFGRAEWWLRLPALLLPFVLAWGAWSLLRAQGEERARLAALLVLLQPADVWNVLVTTDTPVVLFSLLSVLAYLRGMRRASLAWHAAAGLLLGLAFLGKYFAALLGVAFAAHLLFARRDPGRFALLAALTACALLGPAWNLWWNSEHCWSNLVFNFFNRNGKAGFAWENPLAFVASLAYLATPWLLWALWRGRRELAAAIAGDATARALAWLAAVPLLCFFALSFTKAVGLHWLLAFMPLLAALAAAALPVERLWSLCRWSAAFAALHMLAAVVFLALPLSVWKGSSLHAGAVLTWNGPELARQLREPLARCGEGCTAAMESYSSAATLAYALNRPVVVFGDGSFHGRQDDFDTDFRALDGRGFLILRKETVRAESYAPYFAHIDVSSFAIDGVDFHLVHGQGFRYAVYHDRVLNRVRERFYRIPDWLPLRGCAFTDRYFPGDGK
ncbi:ArnT family glycosyltransferase [Azospira restricta]|uniref:Glycosyltransferase family 39 protein n=1 Tax=Azospira restricta TaxID=404405 RepID=A0A974Y5D8_9RHOO|nr:glycosyltransferase family 39 protein [Azospira restricta]QRJ65255.1 glycosyltransferase family 39 protein [Azospira restricta]